MAFALLTLLATGSIQVEPRTLTFGPQSALLEFVAPQATSVVVRCASCGGGAVSATDPAGPGRFRTRFTFPKEHVPQVVLLALEVKSGAGDRQEWVALPLLAHASLKLETKPHASVTVTIGATVVGPRMADARGKLTVPVVVPPGFAAATVTAADRAGNLTTTSFDLRPQPFPLVVARAGEVKASADLEVPVFAIEPTGAPQTNAARVHVAARLGEIKSVTPRADGLFVVAYRAPARLAADDDTLTLSGDNAAPATASLRLTPGSADRIAVTLEPAEFIAGSGKRIQVTAAVTDQWGNALKGVVPVVSAELGTVEQAPTGALLSLPDAFGTRREARVHASANGLPQGEAVLKLKGGSPVEAQLSVPSRVGAGSTMSGTVALKDAWGNPAAVEGVTVEALGRPGELLQPKGEAVAFTFATRPDDPLGPVNFEARAGAQRLTDSTVTVFPWHRPWGLVAGAFANVGVKPSHGMALGGPRVFLGLRLAALPLELGLEGSYIWFPRADVTPTNAAAVTLEMKSWSAGLCGRLALDLTTRLSLVLSVTLGALVAQATLLSPGRTALQSPSRGPMGRAAAGVGVRVAGGQLVLQAEYGLAPLAGPSVEGNALGFGGALGYVFSF